MKPTATRLKVLERILFHLTLWLWRCVVVTIILVAVLVSLGRQLAPLLHHKKAWLEQNLSASTGQTVSMVAVDAQWEGLIPELAVQGLQVGNTAVVSHALMRIDLLASVRSRSLVFDSLAVNNATIDIPLSKPDTREPVDLRVYLEFLFGSTDLRLQDIHLNLFDGSGNVLQLHVDDLVVQNDGARHMSSGSVTVGAPSADNNRSPVKLLLDFTGSAQDILQGRGQAYLGFGDPGNIPAIQAFIWPLLKDIRPDIEVAASGSISGETWVNWTSGDAHWVSRLSLQNLRIGSMISGNAGRANVKLQATSRRAKTETTMRIDYRGEMLGHLVHHASGLFNDGNSIASLYFPEGNIAINQRQFHLPAWQIVYASDAGNAPGNRPSLTIGLPLLDLASCSQYLQLFPGQNWSSALKRLKPQGRLQDLTITFPLDEQLQWQPPVVRSNLHQVAISAWNGIPALQNVDGYLESSTDSGFVELDSRHGFSMFYPQIYHNAQEYQRALGRISWNSEASGDLVIGAEQLQLQGVDGKALADFRVAIPPQSSPRSPELFLAVSLLNTHTNYRNKYLPFILPQDLLDWLASSIKDGQAVENGFIYRGSLAKDEADERTIQYFARLRDGVIRFDPGWPELQAVQGMVLVDNDKVSASIQTARMYNIHAWNVQLGISPSANGRGEMLGITGDFSAPGDDLLRVLRETPLRNTFGATVDRWQLADTVTGTLDLGIPLGKAAEQPWQEVQLKLSNNNFVLGDIALPLDRLTGDIHYSSRQGITAAQLTASLWGRNQQISISPLPKNNGLPDANVHLKGAIDSQALAVWSGLSFVHFLKGDIPVQGDLRLVLDQADAQAPFGFLSASSDLQGVSVDVPEPFRKAARDARPSTFAATLWKDRQQYRADYGTLVHAVLEQQIAADGSRRTRGDVVAGMPTPPLPEEDFRVHGQLHQANFNEWTAAISQLGKYIEEDAKLASAGPATTAVSPAYPVFDFIIDNLDVGKQAFAGAHVTARHEPAKAALDKTPALPAHWAVDFSQALASGSYRTFDPSTSPRLPELEVDSLQVPSDDNNSGAAGNPAIDEMGRPDPWADMVPQDIPAMNVQIRQFHYGQVNYGSWSFVTQPDKDGLWLHNLNASMPGMNVSGGELKQGAEVYWKRQDQQVETRVTGVAYLSDNDKNKDKDSKNADPGQRPGINSIIEAEKTTLQGDISWRGSPAMMSFRRLRGDVTIHSQNGRFLNSNSSTDMMRIINVFNFSAWVRRLKLDFSDLYKKGISYDKVDGRVHLDEGKMVFEKPLLMDGPSGKFSLQGKLDSVQNSIDGTLVVTLPVNSNAAWITALAVNLPAAVGVYIVSKIFKKEIDNVSSVSYRITGTLDEPVVKFDHMLGKPDAKNNSQDNKK